MIGKAHTAGILCWIAGVQSRIGMTRQADLVETGHGTS